MGRGIIESGLFRAEQYQLEQRTSDPASPEANEEWLRVDIKPTYEDADGVTQTGIAEYRIANGDGSVDTAPVAALGHSTAPEVIDKDRVFVDAGGSPTGTGFIPHATESATYPNRRLQHPTAGLVSMHDALTVSAIPDSVIDDYEAYLYEDQGNTLSDYYNGDLGVYARQQTTVLSGDWTLEASSLSGGNDIIVAPSGVNATPAPGDDWEWLGRIVNDGSDTANIAMLFGADDTSNYYGVRVANGAGFIDIIDQSGQISGTSSITDVSGQDLRGEVTTTTGGDVTFTLFADGAEEASVSVSGTGFSESGTGWRVNGQSGAVSVLLDDAELL